MKKPKYFPNNWKAYKSSPDEFFIPLTYNDFFNWKVMGWALPSSIDCIIREETDGKITEKVYSQSKAALAIANVNILLNNPTGVADQPDVMKTIQEQIDVISQNKDRLKVLQETFDGEE